MSIYPNKEISQCQIDLELNGYFIDSLNLPLDIKIAVDNEDYQSLDNLMTRYLSKDHFIFNYLKQFSVFSDIEHIISLRESKNEWEEDGIWHDDGSRVLAFSLSLTNEIPSGGVLEFREKGLIESQKIPTPKYGEIIVFKTGTSGYEHKINKVIDGKRLIIAGWCT